MTTSPEKAGFTLIEMIVVIAILAIMSTMTVWGINTILPMFRLRSATVALKSDMQLARLYAIRHKALVVSQFNIGMNQYSIFNDDGGGDITKAGNYVKDTGEKVFKTVFLHPHIKIIRVKFGAVEGKFAFNSRGTLNGLAGGIYMQHINHSYRGVAISRIGKITIKTSSDGSTWDYFD